MDSFSSGFNIANKISLNPEFNELVGFIETELLQVLEELQNRSKYHARFKRKLQRLSVQPKLHTRQYNPTLVFYYLDTKRSGKTLHNVIDSNVYSDYNKINFF